MYERQKKSFAPSKRDKRIGKTFSFGNFDVHVPSQEEFQAENNQEYLKVHIEKVYKIPVVRLDDMNSNPGFNTLFLQDDQVVHSSPQNESDKENTGL